MIKGKNVFFRAIEKRDLDDITNWINDPEIADLVVGWSFPISKDRQNNWFEETLSKDSNFTQRWIVESEQDGVLGLTGLWNIDWQNRHALTGLKLGAKEIRGKGYGTDAIMTLMGYAFGEVGLNRLWAEIIDYNIPSYRAYVQKCGWKVEGVLRKAIYRKGEYHNLLRVAILKEEFLTLPTAQDYLPKTDSIVIQPNSSDIATESLNWFSSMKRNDE